MVLPIRSIEFKINVGDRRGVVSPFGVKWIPITYETEKLIRSKKFASGQVLLRATHTTAAVLVQEYEKCLLRDIAEHLNDFAPLQCKWQHDDFPNGKRVANLCKDECHNGHSHGKRILLPTSITLPYENGKLIRGKWERILLLDCDWKPTNPRTRTIYVQMMGEFRS